MIKISGCGIRLFSCLGCPTNSGIITQLNGQHLLPTLADFFLEPLDCDKKDSKKVSRLVSSITQFARNTALTGTAATPLVWLTLFG